jgi:hypothetical protein
MACSITSLEMHAQPLIAHTDYGTPKGILTPSGYDFATYGDDVGTIVGDASPKPGEVAPVFRVPDRSFTTRSVGENAVLRWEYRPGSTFSAGWQ